MILYSTILFFILVQPCIGLRITAQFPSKPITLIIPWAPGGSTDLSGRKLADLTGKILGQPMVIENKPGASGVIGINAVAKAAPDGYTIGAMTYSANVIIPHLRSVPYDTKKDFSFIMQYCEAPMIFSVLIDSPWKTFMEFVEEARKNPGKMKYSTPGPLGGQHIFMEHVFCLEEVKVNHIPVGGGYGGNSTAIRGPFGWGDNAGFCPPHPIGKSRGLAVQPEKRMKAVPDIPTFLELGYKVESPNYTGICAPKVCIRLF